MSNSLDRHIAVVTDGTSLAGSDLKIFIAEINCLPSFFTTRTISEIEMGKFDGIVFDSIALSNSPSVEKLLREFHGEFKPIGAIGLSANLLQSIFGKSLETSFRSTCNDSDHVSDRDFKVLSTSGVDARGVRSLLRELIEMA